MVSVWPLALLCTSLLTLSNAASTFSPARPPALPLAVKSPYLSTWLNAGSDGGNGGYLAGQWPVHWSYVTCTVRMTPVDKFQTTNHRLGWHDPSRWEDLSVDGYSK